MTTNLHDAARELLASYDADLISCRTAEHGQFEALRRACLAVQQAEPSGHAYRYPDGIRFNNGHEVNGNKPSEAIPYYFAAPLPKAPEQAEPSRRMSDSMRNYIEGMSVSVDVSTGEHDAGNRYFGTVTEVMDDNTDKHGVTLLVQDAEPNFETRKPAAWVLRFNDPDPQVDIEFTEECPAGWVGRALPLYEGVGALAADEEERRRKRKVVAACIAILRPVVGAYRPSLDDLGRIALEALAAPLPKEGDEPSGLPMQDLMGAVEATLNAYQQKFGTVAPAHGNCTGPIDEQMQLLHQYLLAAKPDHMRGLVAWGCSLEASGLGRCAVWCGDKAGCVASFDAASAAVEIHNPTLGEWLERRETDTSLFGLGYEAARQDALKAYARSKAQEGDEPSKCPDGLLPDGETCPRCGGRRGPSGIDGGTWVHCAPSDAPAPKAVPVPFGWFYELNREDNPKAGPVYLGSNDRATAEIVAKDEGATPFPLYASPVDSPALGGEAK